LSIVSYEMVIEAAEKCNDDRSSERYLKYGSAYMEAGMDEILKRMAKVIYLDYQDTPDAQESIDQLDKAESLYMGLMDKLPQYEDSLSELNDAFSRLAHTRASDEFINGFLACYRFFNRVR
jgi:uncharacterized protein HemY